MKYLFIGLLLISMAVFAEDNGTVIVTSDNEADLTAAEAAAENANASIVSSPWGEDSNSTLESISAKHPREIIIIGGPVAIPAELEAKLKEKYRGLNVSIIRVSGLAVLGQCH
jgi:putative cell wall-binding protein